jgi:hypothetical protein
MNVGRQRDDPPVAARLNRKLGRHCDGGGLILPPAFHIRRPSSYYDAMATNFVHYVRPAAGVSRRPSLVVALWA